MGIARSGVRFSRSRHCSWWGAAHEADDPGAKATPAAAMLPTLTTPDSAGEWSRVHHRRGPGQRRGVPDPGGGGGPAGTTPLFAEYERDDGATLAYLGFNVDPTSAYADQLADTPRWSSTWLSPTPASWTDRRWTPVSSGGALACGTLPAEYQVDGLTCAWADETTSAQVTLVVPELDYDEAAVLTRASARPSPTADRGPVLVHRRRRGARSGGRREVRVRRRSPR